MEAFEQEEYLSALRRSLHSRRNMGAEGLRALFPHKSYVVRSTRTSTRQKRMCTEALEAWGVAYDPKGSLRDTLSSVAHEALVLDIGFGAGETLVAMAHAEPATLFIGVETYKQGISASFSKARELGLKNLRFMCCDAVEVLFSMVENELFDRIQVFFPDPWRKKRHYKRRLLHAPFLHMCYAVLKPCGLLWIVSDWQDYAEDITAHMHVLEEGGLFTRDDEAMHSLEKTRVRSRFEQKGKARGHEVYTMVYRRVC